MQSDNNGIAGDALPSVHIGSESGTPEERFWQWSASLASYFESDPLADPSQSLIPVTCSQYHVGDFLLMDTSFSRQKFIRTPKWVRQNDDADHIALQAFVKGHVDTVSRSTAYRGDDSNIIAVNMRYASEAVSSDADVITFVFPREWICQYIPGLNTAIGPIFGPGSMAARLFRDYMISMRRQIPQASQADAPMLSQNLIGFLAPLLGRGDPLAAEAKESTFQVIEAFIDAHISDISLSVNALCVHFRLSRATLFRLFKKQGGVESFIRRRRLTACFKAVSDPAQFNRKLIDIGLDFGFHNPSHLSSLFKQYFAMTPREVREAAHFASRWGNTVPLDKSSQNDRMANIELMQSWARNLGRG